MMAFVRRLIGLKFELGQGSFGEGGVNAVELSGLRVSAKIIKAGGPSMGTAQVQVFGMKMDLMKKIVTLGPKATLLRKNTITVTAGNEDGPLSTVFIGQITVAWIDFQAAPQVPLHIEAHVGSFDAVKPIAPTSFKGSVDVATVLSGLATQMGKSFQNNGVSVQISNPYYPGSARDQVLAAVTEAGIEWNGLDDNVLAIWPSGKSRGGQAPLVSAPTGMIGYPSFTSQGIMVRTVFNPSIGFGGSINIESDLESKTTPVNGTWNVTSLAHDLQSMVPGGSWSSTVEAVRPGLGPVVSSRVY